MSTASPSPRSADRIAVLSVVERGWRGARQCSLKLSARGIPVTHLLKGWLRPEIRAMIQPVPGVSVIGSPRWCFRAILWFFVLAGTVSGRLRWVIVDHERSLCQVHGWCRRFGVAVLLIRDTREGFELSRDGQPAFLRELLSAGADLEPGCAEAVVAGNVNLSRRPQ